VQAAEFFRAQGWTDHNADKRKEKYTSKIAQMYKVQLEKEMKCVMLAIVPYSFCGCRLIGVVVRNGGRQAAFKLEELISSPVLGPAAGTADLPEEMHV